MQVPVTCDEELEDIDGAFLREQYNQDKAYADQERYFPKVTHFLHFSSVWLSIL